jgi:hypothetical protein
LGHSQDHQSAFLHSMQAWPWYYRWWGNGFVFVHSWGSSPEQSMPFRGNQSASIASLTWRNVKRRGPERGKAAIAGFPAGQKIKSISKRLVLITDTPHNLDTCVLQ